MRFSTAVVLAIFITDSPIRADDATHYAYTLALAQREWQDQNLSRVRELLGGCTPAARGWEWHYLSNQLRPELKSIKGSAVQTLAYSPDGKRIATVTLMFKQPVDPKTPPDAALTIYDVESGKVAASIPYAEKERPFIDEMWFNANSTHLMIREGRRHEIWEIESKKRVVLEHLDCARFTPDGKAVEYMRGDDLKTLPVGKVEEGNITIVGRGKTLGTYFIPGAERCVRGHEDKAIEVIDAKTQKPIHELQDSKGGFEHNSWGPGGTSRTSLLGAFDAAGKMLVAAGRNQTIAVWDLATGKRTKSFVVDGSPDYLALSPDGRQLLVGRDSTVTRWDVFSGKLQATHKFEYRVSGFSFSPDGKTFAVLTINPSIRIFSAESTPEYSSLAKEAYHLSVTSDGKRLLTSSGTGGTVISDLDTGKELVSVRGFTGTISPDGQRIAARNYPINFDKEPGYARNVDLWDGEGKLIRTLKGHTNDVWAIAFSADGKELVTGGNDNAAILWNARTGEKIVEIPGAFTKQPNSLAFDPKGQFIAAAAFTGDVRVFRRDNLKEPVVVDGACGPVAFLPDGKRLVALNSIQGPYSGPSSDFNSIRIVDPRTGKNAMVLKGHSQMVRAIAVHPEGKRLASISDDRTLRIWDLNTGLELLRWRYPGEYSAHSLAFHPDGARLLVGAYQKVLVLDGKAKE